MAGGWEHVPPPVLPPQLHEWVHGINLWGIWGKRACSVSSLLFCVMYGTVLTVFLAWTCAGKSWWFPSRRRQPSQLHDAAWTGHQDVRGDDHPRRQQWAVEAERHARLHVRVCVDPPCMPLGSGVAIPGSQLLPMLDRTEIPLLTQQQQWWWIDNQQQRWQEIAPIIYIALFASPR